MNDLCRPADGCNLSYINASPTSLEAANSLLEFPLESKAFVFLLG